MSNRFHVFNRGVRWALGIKYFSGLLEFYLPRWSAKRFYPARALEPQKNKDGRLIFSGGRRWIEWNIEPSFWVFGVTPEYYRTAPILLWLSKAMLSGGYPTEYSGKMVHVVQKALALKRSHFFAYGEYKTHGIYTPPGSGSDADKKRWIIEIGLDGVYAIPVEFIDERTFEVKNNPQQYDSRTHARYDYALKKDMVEPTLITTHKRLLGKDKKLKLLDGKSMQDRVYKDPNDPESFMHALYAAGGWAFSAHGREAQVVLKAPQRIGVDTSAYYTYRFKVSITADGDGDPLSANIQKMDEGLLYSRRSESFIRIPWIMEELEYNFPFYYDSTIGVDVGIISCPVHVFYIENEPTVVRHKAGSIGGIVETFDNSGAANWGMITPACPCHGTALFGHTMEYNSRVEEYKKLFPGKYAYFSVDGYLDDETQISTTTHHALRSYTLGPPVPNSAGPRILCECPDGEWRVWQTLYYGYGAGYDMKVVSLEYSNVMIIPMRAREAVYIFTREQKHTFPWREYNWIVADISTTSEPYLTGSSPPGGLAASAASNAFTVADYVDHPDSVGYKRNYYLISNSDATSRIKHWSDEIPDSADADILNEDRQPIINVFVGAFTGKMFAIPWIIDAFCDLDYPEDETLSFKLAWVGDEHTTGRPGE